NTATEKAINQRALRSAIMTLSSIEQRGFALGAPGSFVRRRQRIQVAGRRLAVVHPSPQQVAAIDHVDGESILLVLVGEAAPDGVLRRQLAQSLECEREQSPWLDPLMVIVRCVLYMHLQAAAELADMLVECGLEVAGPQPAAADPGGRERAHLRQQRPG